MTALQHLSTLIDKARLALEPGFTCTYPLPAPVPQEAVIKHAENYIVLLRPEPPLQRLDGVAVEYPVEFDVASKLPSSADVDKKLAEGLVKLKEMIERLPKVEEQP